MIGVKRDRRIVGPQGPHGPQGIQGIQGIQGEKGEDGVSELFISKTRNEIEFLIENSQLIVGALYEIKGVNPDLYGGTDIYLKAISTNELESKGVGKFFNPKYDKDTDGFGIAKDYAFWAEPSKQLDSGEYVADDKVIWGGKYWKCISDTDTTTKYIDDVFTLNSDYFEEVPFDENDYNIAFDSIIYDYKNDWIIERNEDNCNIVSYSYDWLVFFSNDFMDGDINSDNPIRNFQWGNIYDFDYGKGIGFQSIKNSLNINLNFRGSYQRQLTFDNGSNQFNLTFDNNSNQTNLTFDNGSSQYNLTFDNGSYQYNLTFDNGSSQYNLTFDNGSSQYNLTFDNGSSQRNLTSNSGKYQRNVLFVGEGINRTSSPLISNEININSFKGTLTSSDYNEPNSENDFVQKKYTDKSNSYSTEETKTGGTWIDGKPIYRKVVEYMNSDFVPMSNTIDISSELPPELETVCYFYHKCTVESDYKIEGNFLGDGFVSVNNSLQVAADNSFNIIYITTINNPIAISESLYDNFQIILEYTKTTD